MSDQPPKQPVTKPQSEDQLLVRLREFVAAGIAITIIVGAVVMLLQAFRYIDSEEFDRVKDLLLFINPLLGVVVGYYFSRVTTEARAEKAETAAGTAMDTAQEATEGRNQAEAEAEAAKSEAEEVTLALKDVSEAAEKMMTQAPSAMGVLGVDAETGEQVEDASVELRMALRHARRFTQ
jgi:hypothetical protein